MSYRKSILFVLALQLPFHLVFGEGKSCSGIFSQKSHASITAEQNRLQEKFELEFNEEYKKEWAPDFKKEFEFILQDKANPQDKVAALRQLGFYSQNGEVMVPTFTEFLRRYQSLLDEAKVPSNQRILPAIPLYRYKTGPRGLFMEIILVTPGVDPWPQEPGFDFLSKYQTFNIPYDIILRAEQRGRFPLMQAAHDVFHFVGYIRSPNYMKSLLKSVRRMESIRPVKNMGFRINYLFEVLSLANPLKKEKIDQALMTTRLLRRSENLKFEDFQSAIFSLPQEELFAHAERLVEVYPELLQDYGGGILRSSEKNRPGEMNELNLSLHLEPRKVRSLGRMFAESPANFARILKTQLDICQATDSQLASILTHKIPLNQRAKWAVLYKTGQDVEAFVQTPKVLEISTEARPLMEKMLRNYLVKMEYLLWRSARDMTAERIIEGVIRADGSFDDEVADFLRDGIGANSNIYQVLRPFQESATN